MSIRPVYILKTSKDLLREIKELNEWRYTLWAWVGRLSVRWTFSPSWSIFLAVLFSVGITIWVLAENCTPGQEGGLGLLTAIHLLTANVVLHQILLSISFFDEMYSASSLRGRLLSSSLPASLKLFNYIVFTIPYCLAFGYPCNYQISSYVKSLLWFSFRSAKYMSSSKELALVH